MGTNKYTAPTLLIFFIFYSGLVFSQLPSGQVSTMSTIYDIIQNSSTGSSFVWSNVVRESNPCLWRGVSCSPGNSSITGLSFQFFSISSSEFLPVVCQIDTLEVLDVSNNLLSSIPDGFFSVCGGLNGLSRLNFSRNRLTGSLSSFTGFTMLEYVDFSYNDLSGEIDLQIDGLVSLRSLNLSRNRFTGNVPIGRSSFLEELQLSFNHFVNVIPQQILGYQNLTLIDLSLNKLSGSIPEDIGQLTKLQVLVLSVNNLTGGIPSSLSNITTLTRFAANQNKFNGTIPYGITRHLRSLDLSFNNLGGTLQSDLISSPNLGSIDLSYNQLEGSIPTNISASLFRLRLGSNSLNGVIPVGSLRSLVNLQYLELDNNSLSGYIPSELGMCRSLALLNLAHNRFTGLLPPALGDLTNLQGLHLQFNNLAGEIPTEITMLTMLQKLNLSRNSFNGSIPLSLSRLGNITNLDLQGNNLSGQIPEIGSLPLLIELQLGDNQLDGSIPAMPQSLQIALNLSHNHLSGHIPDTLARLIGLEVLDLSNNGFSGDIPNFFSGMTSLTQLVLSYNQLSGLVPTLGPHVDVQTIGNDDLIQPPPNPTPTSRRRRRSLASAIIIAVAAAGTAVGLIIVIFIFVSRRFYYRINDERNYDSREEISAPQVIIHENILTPNSIHRSNIDFTKAMEAVSDPLNTILKTRFSTYYKAVMASGTKYFIKKLNWSDKIFQLGSHEKFGEELEVLGKLSNSNVMIPLAYVLTVDSGYLFYEYTPKGTLYDMLHSSIVNSLDWGNRYSIAIGVAQGLAFLHGCSSGQVLLLDLSSKSIMLKSPNEPQIGDIELCKVIDPSKSSGSLSTVAGSVGYIPPEYAYTMRVTATGNVYSFGVVLLELITGKPAVSGGTELAKWVVSNSVQENKWDRVLDFSVSKTSVAVRSQMLAVLKVALVCVSISPDARPKMKSVMRMLLNAR